MHHLDHEISRAQISMIALEEMVSKDSYARLVDDFVEMLPIEQLGFEHAKTEREGRPPYHPKILLKLYMYGYRHGLRSAGKLHRACLVNVELWWLLKGLKPSERTILYFRKNNAAAFKKAFQHFVLLLKDWDLIDGETIAIDSFKIRAQNSLKNNFNQCKIDRHQEYINGKLEEYLYRLEDVETEEELEEINQKIAHQKTKRARYEAIEKELQDSGKTQLSTTDPDARSVVLHRNIVNVGYNIQAGCDSKHKLFINAQTGDVNDTHALAPMAIEAKKLLGLDQMKTLTDKGYTTGAQIAQCTQNNITTYSSPKEHSSQKNGLYDMQDFDYDKEADTYTCPAGNTMHTNGTVYNKGKHRVKHYKTRACKGCPIRESCTRNKNGRYIERGIYQEELENNANRVNQSPGYYRLRQQITEHQFGTLKRQWGFTHTLMKGKENVLSEVYLCFSIYNLVRAAKILGKTPIKQRLKSLVLMLNRQIGLFQARLNRFFFALETKTSQLRLYFTASIEPLWLDGR